MIPLQDLERMRGEWDSRMARSAWLAFVLAFAGAYLPAWRWLCALACVWLGLYAFAWHTRRLCDETISLARERNARRHDA